MRSRGYCVECGADRNTWEPGNYCSEFCRAMRKRRALNAAAAALRRRASDRKDRMKGRERRLREYSPE